MINKVVPQAVNQFEDLLDNYKTRHVRQGEILTGTIVYMEEDIAYVDVGAKTDAVVPASDLSSLDKDMRNALSPGDEVQVYVTQTTSRGGDLIVSIERGLESMDWEKALDVYESGEVGEYRVLNINRGGILVEFGRLSGFVPNSHLVELRRAPHKEREHIKTNLIGDYLTLKVIEVNRNLRRLVLSELNARDEIQRDRLKEIQEGDIVTGNVVSVVPYGAFVDIGNIDGLIHISNLTWEQVNDPKEIVCEGQEIEVKIIEVDFEKERISLSRKALLPNPWSVFDQQHKIGDLVEGEVVRVVEFGMFVQISDGIVGLVHVSEMGDFGSRTPAEVFKPGDKVLVCIIEIDTDKERVGLSIRKVTNDEAFNWMEVDASKK